MSKSKQNKARQKMVAVTPETHRKLERIYKVRKWSYGDAVGILADRELQAISEEES